MYFLRLRWIRTGHALVGCLGRAACPGMRRSLAHDRAGVTAIEYALVALLVMVVIAGAVGGYTGGLGALMTSSFEKVAAAM